MQCVRSQKWFRLAGRPTDGLEFVTVTTSMTPGRNPWLLTTAKVALMVLLTIAAYTPAMRAGFIWDDDDHLTTNPAVTAPDGLDKIWSSIGTSRYYPLTLTSFWVQHRVWGLNPSRYHTVNIILHAVNAVLLFALLRHLRIPGAWLAAMLWALHPVCVESVAWITELKNIQSAFFFLLTLLAYLWFDEQPKPSRYVLMLLCAAAAMLSKSSAVVLPAVLLLMIWWQRGHWLRTDWWQLAPLFAGGLAMSGLTIIEQKFQIHRASSSDAVLSLMERCLLAGKAAWFYLGKSLWPVDLMFLYPRWNINLHSFLNWLPVIGVIGVAIGLWRLRRHPWGRACLFGLGYFVVALLPLLGFFDLFFFRYSYVADHFQYLACIGPIVLVTAAGVQLARPRSVQVIVAAIIILLLWSGTWRYSHVFQSLETLWEDAATKNPDAWLAHNNLGVVLAAQGRLTEATEEYTTALRLKPTFAEAHGNYGNLLVRQGRLTEAANEQLTAMRIDPNFPGAHYNLGNIRALQGNLTEAINEYNAALRIQPDLREAKANLALAIKKRDETH